MNKYRYRYNANAAVRPTRSNYHIICHFERKLFYVYNKSNINEREQRAVEGAQGLFLCFYYKGCPKRFVPTPVAVAHCTASHQTVVLQSAIEVATAAAAVVADVVVDPAIDAVLPSQPSLVGQEQSLVLKSKIK